MRLRSAILASVTAAFALVLSLPTSSTATQGVFRYTYETEHGFENYGWLVDPPSRTCIDLPEVSDPFTAPAHTPRNQTASTATVFTEPGCTGDYFTLRPVTGGASERLKLRSVVFS
jgi:hypothetical protein